jgi:hypothetical protein
MLKPGCCCLRLLKTLFLFLVLEWANQIIIFCNFDIDNTQNDLTFQIVFQKTSTPCWKVFGADDAIWYWQFDYFSKMTIVSLLCRTMACVLFLMFEAINYLYIKHACLATFVSRRLNILSLKFKIRLFCMTSLLTKLYVRVDTLLVWQNTGMIASFSLRRKCWTHKL